MYTNGNWGQWLRCCHILIYWFESGLYHFAVFPAAELYPSAVCNAAEVALDLIENSSSVESADMI